MQRLSMGEKSPKNQLLTRNSSKTQKIPTEDTSKFRLLVPMRK